MNGLYLVKPTSIASTGTGNSSSISANGSVAFSSCATLSLNGVFSADYDNYMIVMRTHANTSIDLYLRLRANGTDDTVSNYVSQTLLATSTSFAVGRGGLLSYWWTGSFSSELRSGSVCYLYGPFLNQETACRFVTVSDSGSAMVFDAASTHNQTVSYDGFTFFPSGGNSISGLLCVYGMVK